MINSGLQNSSLYEQIYQLKEKRAERTFYTVLAIILCGLLCLMWAFTSNFGMLDVSGSSMCNTLYDGEWLLMQKDGGGKKAERGDVIVLKVDHYAEWKAVSSGEKWLIKRLIAIEGDSVRCTDGQIEIKYVGTQEWVDLDEPYAYYTDKEEYDFAEYVVGAGEIFFLGDNRNISQDSRYKENGVGGKRGSQLNCLYKRTDIEGIVPQWVIENQKTLEKIFFLSRRRSK